MARNWTAAELASIEAEALAYEAAAPLINGTDTWRKAVDFKAHLQSYGIDNLASRETEERVKSVQRRISALV